MSYHIHKTSLRRGKSYIKSPEWIVDERATINVKNKDDTYLKYSIIVTLHHQGFDSHPERLSNMHHFFSYDCNWEGIEFPAGIKD